MTMTRDPDLDAAVEHLAGTARRLRHVQSIAASADELKDYAKLASIKAELADLHDEFSVTGERLKLADDRRIAGRALLLITEEVERLRKLNRRRPNAQQVVSAVAIAADLMERARVEAVAEEVLARHAKRIAVRNAAASASALGYLEASR